LPKKPLPERKTVILTREKGYSHLGCKVVHRIKDILHLAESNDIYICGGSNVYEQFMPYADELIISQMEESFDADTFFPKIDEDMWKPYYCEGMDDKVPFDIIKYRPKDLQQKR
jgi:dihydrofolate reductase